MENYKQTVNLLGIAKRAGKIVTGNDFVLEEIRSKKAKLVFIASDAGSSTMKKMVDKCNYYQVPINRKLSRSEISEAIGQERSTVSISDYGFARKFNEMN